MQISSTGTLSLFLPHWRRFLSYIASCMVAYERKKIDSDCYTRHAHAVTFCLASVQKLCCLLFYIKSTVVNLAYASKHHALT